MCQTIKAVKCISIHFLFVMDQNKDFTDQTSIILFTVALFMFDTLSLSSESCAVASFIYRFQMY